MNNQELVSKRRKNWNKYNRDGNPIHRCKINEIRISAANTLRHELAKCEVCWHLNKLKKKFIVEAIDNKTKLRHDVVCLDDDVKYEVETDKRRAVRFKSMSDVVVIELWIKKNNIAVLVGNT